MNSKQFWKNKKVFLTGHTGFKGSWLSIWLSKLGANVTGYSLEPATAPNMFELCNVASFIYSHIGDVRDKEHLQQVMLKAEPDVVIHMAAQPLVRESYRDPIGTYMTNVIGTVHLLEAVRNCPSVRAVVNVTTDKCYENKEWVWGYREHEKLGGYDPYSSSKACSELITASYRSSFFNPERFNEHQVGIATARAGNVIGGGDWTDERLVPDSIRALLSNEKIIIRSPHAIRPWQHVLEPLQGYLTLAQRLYEDGKSYSEAWNFGPNEGEDKPVEWVVRNLCEKWGEGASYEVQKDFTLHEAHYLKLDCSKAKHRLFWKPRWNTEQAIDKIIEWYLAYRKNQKMLDICLHQISEYAELVGKE